MGCLLWLYQNQLLNLIFILSFIQLTCLQAQPCPHDQRFALLQFKKHFSFNKSASYFHCDDIGGIPSYPKPKSWKEGTNCCSWDGVECDRGTGHVIGLDLSCSWLSGAIHPNSTLFLFSHLQKLNLAFNDFKNSSISSTFSRFTRLTHLNLSRFGFYGQISSEISFLSKLTSLDLSGNYNLRLKNPSFQLLVQNLTKLRDLNLDQVNISSTVPNSLFNLTSLTYLSLVSCGLQEKFPDDIFHLPNLNKLVLWANYDLTGHFPKFNSSSPLQYLDLDSTSFSRELPHSIGNLKSLNTLYVDDCKFSGSIPASLGNLTQITILGLSGNTFNGSIASVIPYLKNLRSLTLGGNNISDPFLPLASNLTKLVELGIWDTQVAGSLPSHVSGLSNLASLVLYNYSISGTIPSWLFTLPSLRFVYLMYNKFTGHINDFQSNSLEIINLSNNKLHGTIPSSIFQLVNLTSLDLSSNDLTGSIPNLIFQLANLTTLDLSSNNLSGTIEKLPWKYIQHLNLHSNLLQGPLPVPPPSTITFLISNNKLTGDIPSLVCNASIFQVLDLSDNNLSGVIPQCLGNFSKVISVLDLRKNNFHGTIPNTFTKGNRLSTIAFNGNELEGKIPKSLVNCIELEVLDLGNNNLSDRFPYWLENLPKLHVLILRSNRFHGSIATSKTNFSFPNLRVIDISYNDFSGPLPTKYFKSLKAMRNVDESTFELEYMRGDYYQNSLSITIKGSIFEMEKILTIFTIIDLSKNKFEGKIPEFIGKLNSIRGLNLSHNSLSGQIPTSFKDLKKLESLDLSSNMLTGKIPQQLTDLTFLEVFNVSHNQLTGLIPQGNQFNTFSNDSYIGNFGLCGSPLTKKCNNFEAPQPPMILDELESTIEFDWKVILMGYGCGLVFGLSMGYLMFSTGKPKWLVRIIEDKQHKSKKRSKKHATSHRCRRN